MSTDAAAQDGSRIELLGIPVGELIKDKAKFEAFDTANDWHKMVRFIEDVPGVRIEPKAEEKVQFE